MPFPIKTLNHVSFVNEYLLHSTELDKLKEADAARFDDLPEYLCVGAKYERIGIESLGYCSFRDKHKSVRVEIREEKHVTIERKHVYTIHDIDKALAEIEQELTKTEQNLKELGDIMDERQRSELRIKWKRLKDAQQRLKDKKERHKNHPAEEPIEERYTINSPLGLYMRTLMGPTIYLYINSIRNVAHADNVDSAWVLVETYAHEMHHALYDTDQTIGNNCTEYIEEPMAELGMLAWLKAFDQTGQIWEHAMQYVETEKEHPETCYYGFGHWLAQQKHVFPIHQILAYKPIIDGKLIDKYSSTFRLGIYPFWDEAKYERLIFRILTGKNIYTTISVNSSRARYLPESWFNAHLNYPTEILRAKAEEYLNHLPPELFSNQYSTFFNPFRSNQAFTDAVVDRLDKGLAKIIPNPTDRMSHIKKYQVWVVDDAFSDEYLLSYFDNSQFIKHNLIHSLGGQCRFQPKQKNRDKSFYNYRSVFFQSWDVHFDVVFGVLPSTINCDNRLVSIYPYFIHIFNKIIKAETGWGVLTFPADWYVPITRWKREQFRDIIQSNLFEIINDRDSKGVFGQNVLMCGVCCGVFTKCHATNDIQYFDSNGCSNSYSKDFLLRTEALWRDPYFFDIVNHINKFHMCSLRDRLSFSNIGSGFAYINQNLTNYSNKLRIEMTMGNQKAFLRVNYKQPTSSMTSLYIDYLRSNLVAFLVKITCNSKRLSPSNFIYVPDIYDIIAQSSWFPKTQTTLNDEEVYKLFDLSQNEISYIESALDNFKILNDGSVTF